MTFPRLALLLVPAVAHAPWASAHSVKDLQSLLGDKEKYFQSMDKPAPGFSLRGADGKAVRLADLRGKVVVLHFIYTNCADVCPLHAEKLAEVQTMVNGTPMKELVRFVSITTDPKRDTAGVLHEYGPTHGLDSANWSFLTSSPDRPTATRELAERYGHKFITTKDGYQMHGVVTHIIGRDGLWRANFHGLKFEPVNLVLLVNALVNDVHRPERHRDRSFWDRVRKFF